MQQIGVLVHAQAELLLAKIVALVVLGNFVLVLHVDLHADALLRLAVVLLAVLQLVKESGKEREIVAD